MNPIDYLLENISWYAPIYNISWVLFMVFALTLPLILMAIGLIYEYLVLNYDCYEERRLISLKMASKSRGMHLLANLIMLLLFISFFSVFSETYEFVSKYFAGLEFDSSGLDTWLDILNNVGGAYIAYGVLWLVKYGLRGGKNLQLGAQAAFSYGDD